MKSTLIKKLLIKETLMETHFIGIYHSTEIKRPSEM